MYMYVNFVSTNYETGYCLSHRKLQYTCICYKDSVTFSERFAGNFLTLQHRLFFLDNLLPV